MKNVLKENVMNSNSKYNRNEWYVHIYVCEKARNRKHTYFRKHTLSPHEHWFMLSDWFSAIPLVWMHFLKASVTPLSICSSSFSSKQKYNFQNMWTKPSSLFSHEKNSAIGWCPGLSAALQKKMQTRQRDEMRIMRISRNMPHVQKVWRT